MKPKGRRVAVAAAALGIAVVLVWAGLEIRYRVLEDRAIERLKSKDRGERGEAARALEEIGSVRAIPAIIELIEKKIPSPMGEESIKEYWSLKEALLRIIARRGPAAVPVLVPLLRSDEGEVCGHAADLLADIGAEADGAIPALEATLHDHPDFAAAIAAMVEIGADHGPLITDIVRLCRHEEWNVREKAVLAARSLGKEEGKAAVLSLRVNQELDLPISVLAASALEYLDDDPLRAILHDPKRSDASKSVPALIAALGDKKLVKSAIVALEAIGPGALPAVTALLEKAKDADPGIRQETLLALGSIGEADGVLPVLRAALGDTDKDTRLAAVIGLGRLGPGARTAAPALEDLARTDPSPKMKAFAEGSLAAIFPERLAPTVRKMEEDLRRSDKTWAAEILGELGPRAKAAVPEMVRVYLAKLRDPGGYHLIPLDVERALCRIGLSAMEAIPLIDALRDPEAGVRHGAIDFFSTLGPKASVALDALIGSLDDPELFLRAKAAEAFRRIGPEARAAIPALERALRTRNREVRFQARWALERIRGTKD